MSDVNFDELEDDDLDNLFSDLTYNGLDLDKIRANLAEKDPDEAVNNVLLCLVALSKAGNNVNRLSDKVKNPKTGSKLKKILRDMKVKKRATTADDITLPRIGLAFLPAYLLLRFRCSKFLQSQTSAQLDVAYKDVSFCGVPQIWADKHYREFYNEFSKMIGKKDDDEEEEDDEDDKPKKKRKVATRSKLKVAVVERPHWVNVAYNGYMNDSVIHGMMAEAMKPDEISYEAVKVMISRILKAYENKDQDTDMDEGNTLVPPTDDPGQLKKPPPSKSNKPPKTPAASLPSK